MSLLDTILTRARAPSPNGKALGDSPLYRLHPELAERVPILRVESGMEGPLPQSDYGESAGYYQTQAWVHKAVKIIADNACPLPVRVVKGDERESEAQPSHEISQLLANPNGETSPADLWRAWATDMLLGGEHGLEAVKAGARYKELWNRPPPDFTLKPGEGGKRYKRIAYYRIDDGESTPYNLPPEEFVHLKFYNPLNPWRGLAPITAIRLSIIIDQLAQVWSRLFFKNNARPDYAVITPEGLTATERDEMELRLMMKHGGQNQHRPIVLEQGVSDIKTLTFRPKDMEWLAQREFSRDEIGAIFGVPDEIMGFGRDTYENFDTARSVLWTLTIMPINSLRDDTLTRFFRKVGKLKPDERIETDYSNVPELQENVTEKIEQLNILASRGYAINALNEWLGLGLPDQPGGDVGYLPNGMISLSGVSSDDSATVSDTASPDGETTDPEIFGYHLQYGVVGRNEARDRLNLPPEDESIAERLRDLQAQLSVMEIALRAGFTPGQAADLVGITTEPRGSPPIRLALNGKQIIKTPPYGSQDHKTLWEGKQARIDEPVEKMQRKLKRFFQEQQNDVLRKLRNNRSYGRGKFKQARTGTSDKDIPPPSDLFDEDEWADEFEERFREDVLAVFSNAALLELVDLSPEDFPTLEPSEFAVRAVRAILEKVARKTSNTTWLGIVDIIEQAERDGLGIVATQELLNDYFAGRKSDFETERIARTTMTGADNSGSLEGWTQSGVVKGKTWISALSNRTRPEHAEAHGQTVELDETYTVGGESLEYPGDPAGSPGNIINCLCSQIPEL